MPAKPLKSWVATLRKPNGCQHPAGETDQHAEVTGGRAGGHRQRVAQIGRTVGVGGVGAAHGAGQHHRNGAVVGQVQPQRGLFHGVGAVSDDHPVGAVTDRGPHRGADPVPVGRRQLGAVDRHQVDDIDVREPDGQVRAAAGGSAHPVGAGAGRDGSSGGDDDKSAHGAIIPHAAVGDDGGVPEEPTGSAEPVTQP